MKPCPPITHELLFIAAAHLGQADSDPDKLLDKAQLLWERAYERITRRTESVHETEAERLIEALGFIKQDDDGYTPHLTFLALAKKQLVLGASKNAPLSTPIHVQKAANLFFAQWSKKKPRAQRDRVRQALDQKEFPRDLLTELNAWQRSRLAAKRADFRLKKKTGKSHSIKPSQ